MNAPDGLRLPDLLRSASEVSVDAHFARVTRTLALRRGLVALKLRETMRTGAIQLSVSHATLFRNTVRAVYDEQLNASLPEHLRDCLIRDRDELLGRTEEILSKEVRMIPMRIPLS